MTTQPPSVVVVGAGPAGASLAYLLASRGVPVTLLERQRDFAREFRGEILLPSGLQALEEMGLQEVFEAVPRSQPRRFEIFANARPVLELQIEPEVVGRHPPTTFSQPAFLEAVIEASRAHARFEVALEATVVGLSSNDGRVCGVEASVGGVERAFPAKLVVGADGRSSAVRRHGRFEVEDQGLEVDVVWFKVPLPAFLSEDDAPVRVYIGRAHLLIAYPAWDGRLQVAWVINKGTYGELRRRGVEEWVEEIEHHVTPDLGAHLRAHREALSNTFLLSAASNRVTSWSIPGALLIGDAAHTMSPVGGQGINIALRDAVVAANHLIPALRAGAEGAGIDAAAQAMEAERMPELVKIQRLQSFPPRILMGHTWWAAVLRSLLPRLVKMGVARKRAGKLVQTLLFGVGEVRLKV